MNIRGGFKESKALNNTSSFLLQNHMKKFLIFRSLFIHRTYHNFLLYALFCVSLLLNCLPAHEKWFNVVVIIYRRFRLIMLASHKTLFPFLHVAIKLCKCKTSHTARAQHSHSMATRRKFSSGKRLIDCERFS